MEPLPRPRLPRSQPTSSSPLAVGRSATWAPARAWLLLPVLAVLVLAWSLRGGTPGVAVADDYTFLHRIRFQHPLDPFDSMGASYYWRPVSRQLYFSLVGPLLPQAPWVPAVLHLALVVATGGFAFSVVRRLAGSAAGAIAAAALLSSEPVRVLVAWPSGSQHLLGACLALAALREALAARLPTAALAALLGVLSHELAGFVLPLLPFAARWSRVGTPVAARRSVPAVLPVALVAAVWIAGYAIARSHGVSLPPFAGPVAVLEGWGDALWLSFDAAMNLEVLPRGASRWLLAGQVLVIAAAIQFAWERRAAAGAALRAAGLAAATWAVATLPLAMLLPDWNAWRAWVPVVALLLGVSLVVGRAPMWLGGAWIALRLAALLLAPQPEAAVSRFPPPATSHLSFVRLTRLQRLVSATRRELTTLAPPPARGGVVRYWMMPQLGAFAFQGPRAVQVWLGDPGARWEGFGGPERLERAQDPLIEFLDRAPRVARLLPESVVRQSTLAALALARGDSTAAIAAWQAAIDSLPGRAGWMYGSALHHLAMAAYARGDRWRADSLHRLAEAAHYSDPAHWTLGARLALERGDSTKARQDLSRALSLDPLDAAALRLAHAIGLAVAAPPPAAGE